MPEIKNKVTIIEVAARAKVGISTVSRVLNDSPNVARKTRERVQQAIGELKYRPDRTARYLARKTTRYLAVAIPSFTTPFHTELLKGVRQCLVHEEIDLLLCDLGSRDRRDVLINFLHRGDVDGLLLIGVPMDEISLQELKTLRGPVVLVGRPSEIFDSYWWDDEAGAHAAVTHLIKQGHRRIGLIRAHMRDLHEDERFQGYQKALSEANLPLDVNLVIGGETEKHRGYSEETGYEAMQKLLQIDPSVTAVFACSDVQALGAWKAIVDVGKRVPDEIALVGYDNLKSSHYLGLTSINQRIKEIGKQATNTLLQRMRGEKVGEPDSVLITPDIIVRRSSLRASGGSPIN